jgi:hypothetical protein
MGADCKVTAAMNAAPAEPAEALDSGAQWLAAALAAALED